MKQIQQEDDLHTRMITDAIIILKSVSFLEREINRNFSLLEEAVNNKFKEDVVAIEQRIRHLLDKIGCENTNMDKYMSLYSQKVNDEKKTILSGVK
jgi:hypothetical protein